MPDGDLQSKVEDLVRTLHDLTRKHGGWVPWPTVARSLTGAAETVAYWKAIVELPAYANLFHANGSSVKLSLDGLHFALSLPSKTLSIPEFIAQSVIAYARGLKPILLRVTGVSTVSSAGSKVVQALHHELIDEILPSETPVTIYASTSRPVRGKLVGQEPDAGVIYAVLDSEILPVDLPARLAIDRAQLLSELADQLNGLPVYPDRLTRFDPPAVVQQLISDHDSASLAHKLFRLQTPWTRFLWGPPGAGKTFGIAQFAANILNAAPDETILLVAPSNRAVDVALSRIRNALETNGLSQLIAGRKVLRFGYPRTPEILELPELLGPSGLDELNQLVRDTVVEIEKAERERRSDADIAVLRARQLAEQEAVKEAVRTHVQQCSVVATTTTLAFMASSPVVNRHWDTVIVDEVTMVPPAIGVFLASRARKRLVFAGDPRQLGPVYEHGTGNSENSRFWLGTDVFHAWLKRDGENGQFNAADWRMARITAQHRCAGEIWGAVSHLYPEVKNAANVDRLRNCANLPPAQGNSVVLLDTSHSPAKCENWQKSWRNAFTAGLAMEVATMVAAEMFSGASVSIICPYRAQVRLLRQSLREERKAEDSPLKTAGSKIETGTVHQFQGSESDVVIFDLVDGKGRSTPGRLLSDDTGLRLVNVAITRARGKLIVIADKDWCSRANIKTHNSLLHRLIFGSPAAPEIAVIPADEDASRRRSLDRKTESPIEELLLDEMSRHEELAGVETQFLIFDDCGTIVSRADFAFPEVKYAVYCDGRQWHLREDRWHRDLRQRNTLTELGWAFSVFSGRDINRDAHACAIKILETFRRRPPHTR
jgi:very-short-patch-repair endonuclease